MSSKLLHAVKADEMAHVIKVCSTPTAWLSVFVLTNLFSRSCCVRGKQDILDNGAKFMESSGVAWPVRSFNEYLQCDCRLGLLVRIFIVVHATSA